MSTSLELADLKWTQILLVRVRSFMQQHGVTVAVAIAFVSCGDGVWQTRLRNAIASYGLTPQQQEGRLASTSTEIVDAAVAALAKDIVVATTPGAT